MSLEEHHKFILNAMDRQNAIARKFVAELEAENARLKAECQARQAENSVLAVECDSLKAEVERLTKFNEETSAYIAKEERKMEERYEMMQEDIDKLIKAGDDLAAHIGNDEASQDKCAVVWRAVKKEVQS